LNYISQKIPGVILIEPKIHDDSRGYFFESFRNDLLEKKINYKISFVQDNESKSSKGVLRGLHYQVSPYAQSKLVRVIKGRVLDVIVDIRLNSPTFGQHIAIELNEDNKKQLFIPSGLAHGFLVLSDTAIFSYKTDNYYAYTHERGIAYNDEKLSIDWLMPIKDLYLSNKDKSQPLFSHTDDFPTFKLK